MFIAEHMHVSSMNISMKTKVLVKFGASQTLRVELGGKKLPKMYT